jgi:sugar/nucleoside kinase (ribokinase family)
VPVYAARALSALGERATLITRCAEEDRALLAPLRAYGLPVAWHEGPSAVFRLEYREGKRSATIEALGDPWRPADIRGWMGEPLRDADWVHAGALWRGEFPPETLAELARGRRLSLDGQGLVRPGRLGPVVRDAAYDPAVLGPVDLLHLSEGELDALGLSLDERSLRSLCVPEIVVTLGDRGAVVFADDVTELVRAAPLANVDPTGAGDSFTAAYIAARRRGHGPVSAAATAAALVHGLLSGKLGR